jgi:hypothetical protein
MKHSLIRRLLNADLKNLLEALSTRQHLNPHEPLADALAHTVDSLGVCPNAIEQSLRWLSLDPATSIGRLRRTELTQLARSIHRFWRQRQPQTPSQTPSAPATH